MSTNPYYYNFKPYVYKVGNTTRYIVSFNDSEFDERYGTAIEISRNNLDGNLELLFFYATHPDYEDRTRKSPIGMPKKLLCALLHYILYTTRTTEQQRISLNAVADDDDELITKVYIPMGFIVKEEEYRETDFREVPMEASVKKIMAWCRRTQNMPFTQRKNLTGFSARAKKLIEKKKKNNLGDIEQ